ncbi:MAG: xanthine dehydrogenase family protein molybdopterin-binding subunit [Chloroflexi bacterium]|nr:xanthine dehydrogenase family protein molybdopterin-binding subunit [Chloroflexota bacterium]
MVATDRPGIDHELTQVGTRPVRPDGVDKVTGRARFGVDVNLPRMLYGRVKRSPHAHARILNIDASRALALPGVRAVVTAKDFPAADDSVSELGESVSTARFLLENVLASDKVLYTGHAVAAVAATDPHIAEDALELIDVQYEVLPPVLDVLDAMQPGAPLLHRALRTVEMAGLFMPGTATAAEPSNVASHIRFERGDIEAGFAASDVVIEREFRTSTAHQGYIEPHNGTAFWNADGELTVWVSTQGHFGIRDQLAQILKLPLSKLHVVPMEIGGGFGGKIPVYMEPPAAIMSQQTGHPVKMLMNRKEVFEATGPTSATYIRAKIGAKRDGTILAAQAYLAFEAGAFPGSPVGAGAACAFSSYDIPNQLIDGYDVVVNKPKVQAYRAPGSPQATFATESILDEIAEQLDIDPLELRLKNASSEGTRRSDGAVFPRIGARELIEAARDTAHYRSELSGANRGRGVALGFWFNGGGESAAYATANSDGTVALTTGSVDIGGQRAALAQQFAEAMGIPYERIVSQVGDTDSVGYTRVTGGSRTTFATGWAVYEAAMELRRQLEARAAMIWECEPSAVHYSDDAVLHGPAGKEMAFAQLCAQLPHTGGMLQGRAGVAPMTVGPAFACHIVDVEVDPDTGKVTVLRYTALQDVGKAIHPSYVEGQIQGGAAQGVGMALTEEYRFDNDGRMLNPTLLDYRMPTTLDLPPIETVLVEVANPGHPYGVRGVGEVPIVPPLGAVANALASATGSRMRTLPATPERVLDALLEAKR